MGRSELQRLHGQMDAILKEIGYTQGSVGERMKGLAKDPKYKFSDGDKGRAEIMAFINNRLDWIRAQMPRAFNTLVTPNMEVKRLPPEEEPGAPGAYGGAGSIDGKIPGRYWINLRTPALHSKYSLADLSFHEAIPGHIWQGEYTHGMPLIRQLLAFNAYSEGWGLYAEQLADELGAYETDRVGRLGYLQSIAFRACRLVVDTGLHAKRWTREQGVQFFVDVNGSNPEEVASEVDRYCSWPGQACGYKVGHSEINRQREKAKTSLGVQIRSEGVQRYRGARRQRPARRAREERRRVCPDRVAVESPRGAGRVGRQRRGAAIGVGVRRCRSAGRQHRGLRRRLPRRQVDAPPTSPPARSSAAAPTARPGGRSTSCRRRLLPRRVTPMHRRRSGELRGTARRRAGVRRSRSTT